MKNVCILWNWSMHFSHFSNSIRCWMGTGEALERGRVLNFDLKKNCAGNDGRKRRKCKEEFLVGNGRKWGVLISLSMDFGGNRAFPWKKQWITKEPRLAGNNTPLTSGSEQRETLFPGRISANVSPKWQRKRINQWIHHWFKMKLMRNGMNIWKLFGLPAAELWPIFKLWKTNYENVKSDFQCRTKR